jgi:DNA-directed RNA polymerase subunit RPC12/RpoP
MKIKRGFSRKINLGNYETADFWSEREGEIDISNLPAEEVKAYNQKPYKKYLIPLNCAHCGHKNEIEIDLTDTEFRCTNCLKYNGIHTNFMAAAITEPVSQVES